MNRLIEDVSPIDDVARLIRGVGILVVVGVLAVVTCSAYQGVARDRELAGVTQQRDSLRERGRRRAAQATEQATRAAAAEFKFSELEMQSRRSSGDAIAHRPAMRLQLAEQGVTLPRVVEVQLALDSIAIADSRIALPQARLTIDLYRPALDSAIAGALDAQQAQGLDDRISATAQRKQFWRGVKVGSSLVFILVTVVSALVVR